MRERISILFVLAGLVCLIFSTSCTKCDEETTSQTFKQATIKGDALANLDLSNDTNQWGGYEVQLEKVPSGTIVFARINSYDLDPNPDNFVDYQDITFETEVNNGEYEVMVYAGPSNVGVTLLADEFTYQTKINDSTYEWRVYAIQNQNLSVINDQTKFQNLIFN